MSLRASAEKVPRLWPGYFFARYNVTLNGDRITRLGCDAPSDHREENLSTAPRLPRKRRSLARERVTVLSEQIRDGQLNLGDKLPTESAIMEAHGVSRTAVHEAISHLQAPESRRPRLASGWRIGCVVLQQKVGTPAPPIIRPLLVVEVVDVLASQHLIALGLEQR